MIKFLLQKTLSLLGLQLRRISRPSSHRRPLPWGEHCLENVPVELMAAYRDYPESNTVIGRIARLLSAQGPLGIIDIGANCGDTLAIAKAAAPASAILCVEGDQSLFLTLKKNSASFSEVTIKQSYLGESATALQVSIAQRGHNNTLTSGAGNEVITLQTLDTLVADWPSLPSLHFIKCDTEGYDVRILHGASETLRRYQPALLFEYNLQAMHSTGEKGFRVFTFLQELGYHTLLVYDNYGRFLLKTDLHQRDLLQDLHQYLQAQAGSLCCYYDFLVFSRSQQELSEIFLHLEREHRQGHTETGKRL